ncbi:MAG: DUF3299 domain-containing protein [Pseudomonadota bacterium]
MSRMSAFLITALLLAWQPLVQASEPQEVYWEDLVPEGWYPPEPDFSSSFFIDHEADPAAVQPSMDAPVVESMHNKHVKIPGFILPVEFEGDAVIEFLLVPYVGACIHVPPPPPNQIVLVELEEPLVGTDLFDPVWVEGELRIESVRSLYAQSSYTLAGKEITKYEW